MSTSFANTDDVMINTKKWIDSNKIFEKLLTFDFYKELCKVISVHFMFKIKLNL